MEIQASLSLSLSLSLFPQHPLTPVYTTSDVYTSDIHFDLKIWISWRIEMDKQKEWNYFEWSHGLCYKKYFIVEKMEEREREREDANQNTHIHFMQHCKTWELNMCSYKYIHISHVHMYTVYTSVILTTCALPKNPLGKKGTLCHIFFATLFLFLLFDVKQATTA